MLSVIVLRYIHIAGCSVACFFSCPILFYYMEVSVDGPSGYFWVLPIMSKGTENICVQVICFEKPGGVGLLGLTAGMS